MNDENNQEVVNQINQKHLEQKSLINEQKEVTRKAIMNEVDRLSYIKQEHGYKEIKSIISQSPRGDGYMYAEVWDNKIISIGEEQGNYVGGDLATSENKENLVRRFNKLKKFYEDYLATGKVSYESSLFEQIKDFEIADTYPEELK